MKWRRGIVKSFGGGVVVTLSAGPALGDIPLRATRVASGLARPVFVTAPPGDTSRLFILEQHTGMIKILNLTGPSAGTINATPFLDLNGHSTGEEQGVLGMAFHPNYASNGQFYVHYTAPGGAFNGGQINVVRYTRSATSANIANPSSAQPVIRFDHPQGNHNAGWIGFGPRDGYLYITSGDGGNGNDQGTGHTEPGGNAQDVTNNLLGKMLRLDVNGDDFPTDTVRNYRIPRGGVGQPPANPFAAPGNAGDDEIWALGLRNPFRASHDRLTGDMYIGDVGQGAREEISFQPGNSVGGENYGWRLREGLIQTPGSVGGPRPPGNVDPIHDYDRTVGSIVTGGYVYRGPENPALDGNYFFADFGNGKIWSLKYTGTAVTKFREHTGQIPTDVGTMGLISSFGEDALGRLYVVDLGGEVFRLVPPVPGDANLDRSVTFADFQILYNNFGPATGKTWRTGDFDDNGVVDFIDFQILERSFGRSVPFGSLPEGSMVPEPGAAVGLVGGLLLMGRRRHRRQ